MSFSNTGDVILISSSQNKELHDSYSTPTTKDSLEGKTMAVIAVMRGKPKAGYRQHRSNKLKLVWNLLDSGSDGMNIDKPILLPYSKRLVPQPWNTSNGIFQAKPQARIELNFFKYSDSKRFYSEPDVVGYNKGS
jgi:hypothetical protein